MYAFNLCIPFRLSLTFLRKTLSQGKLTRSFIVVHSYWLCNTVTHRMFGQNNALQIKSTISLLFVLERYYQRAQIESMLRHLETNRSTLGGLISGKTLYAVNPLLYLFKEGNHSWILEFLSNNTDNTRPEEYYRNIAG